MIEYRLYNPTGTRSDCMFGKTNMLLSVGDVFVMRSGDMAIVTTCTPAIIIFRLATSSGATMKFYSQADAADCMERLGGEYIAESVPDPIKDWSIQGIALRCAETLAKCIASRKDLEALCPT